MDVQPGQTLHLDLGGTGRPIVGRVSKYYTELRGFLNRADGVKEDWGYEFDIRPDGSFRADEIPAGTYTLSIIKDLLEAGKQPIWGAVTGKISVTVPEIPGGQRDDPLEVGTVELKEKSS